MYVNAFNANALNTMQLLTNTHENVTKETNEMLSARDKDTGVDENE